MLQSRVMETWVGVFVALGLLGLFFLAMQVSNLGALKFEDNSYTVTARFSNVGSLKVRAPVSMSGVRVGRVSAIRFDKKSFEAVVEMKIDPYFNTIPSDTSASILTQGLLGEQYIGLTPGALDEPLTDGDKIEMTQSAMILEQLISRFLFSKAEEGSNKQQAEPAPAAHSAEKPKPPAMAKKIAATPVKAGVVSAAPRETRKNGQH
ncbi:outer membrane lipid asymmetry maintenance protein MlaD [Candidatus Methylospira mobilis]|uniref:outer membrane lipid asymmetry maintenance protein MlaD n=1 Tax=Candidatus Methylospira mobilis TaxID=1808979 RepID=UPI001884E65D|nr:outer membrane lipid asymmetry maintenance protein MlaD [Candidatus Methylospira mobilis]